MDYVGMVNPYATLSHHGVKGMKWGVRRYQNYDGTWKKKARIGSAERVRQKQEMFRSKIKANGDTGIKKYTINDWRRGRIAQLETKRKHRQAKETYKRTHSKTAKTMKQVYGTQRLVKNGVLAATPLGNTFVRGAYNRNRQAGETITKAILGTAGTAAVILAFNAVENQASQKLGEQLTMQMLNKMGGM